MATLRDIAAHSGTSLATVSRVLNGNQSVDPALAARVLDTASTLGYTRNHNRNNKKQTIAVLVTWPSTSPSEGQQDKIFAMTYIHSIYSTAEKMGYHLDFHFGDASGQLSSYLQWKITTKQFQGAIIVGSYFALEQAYVQSLREADIPFFRLSKAPAEYRVSHSYVAVDDYAGGYRAGQHLLSCGVSTLLHIAGPLNSRDAIERKQGFVQACKDKGIQEEDIPIFPGDFHESSGARCAREILKLGKYPQGIFAANDMMAIGCMRTLQNDGVQIPQDIQIVGFDDLLLASYVQPALTTIRVPFLDIARVAVEELVRQIGCPMRKTTKVVLDGELIVRQSSGIAETNNGGGACISI
ncbi:MAG: LacI family transcriptional regulator [Limnochordia bacterium]|jgi:LacI family transcriptional regulator|nr:LacI family transcriptional regulator [Limnochordia bacterium]